MKYYKFISFAELLINVRCNIDDIEIFYYTKKKKWIMEKNFSVQYPAFPNVERHYSSAQYININ